MLYTYPQTHIESYFSKQFLLTSELVSVQYLEEFVICLYRVSYIQISYLNVCELSTLYYLKLYANCFTDVLAQLRPCVGNFAMKMEVLLKEINVSKSSKYHTSCLKENQ